MKQFLLNLAVVSFFLIVILIDVSAENSNIETEREQKKYSASILTEYGSELPIITYMSTVISYMPIANMLSGKGDDNLSLAIHNYCLKKGFPSKIKKVEQETIHPKKLEVDCNILESIINDLKSSINLYIPKFKMEPKQVEKKTDSSRSNKPQTKVITKLPQERERYNVIPEMTLIEKEKYPFMIFIRDYGSKIIYRGNTEEPKLFKKEGSFNGNILLKTEFIIEIKKSKNLEVIDRIEFKKTYESKPVYFKGEIPFLGSPIVISDNRIEAFIEIFEQFYDDILKIFREYNWDIAHNFSIRW